MKKNEKETAILIAVCAFISLLILSPFMFFLLSNEHKTETVYSNYMTIKNKYTKVKPAEKEAFAILGGISYLNFTESPEETFYYLKTVRNISIFKIDKNGNRNYSHKIIQERNHKVSKEIYDKYNIGDRLILDKENECWNMPEEIINEDSYVFSDNWKLL